MRAKIASAVLLLFSVSAASVGAQQTVMNDRVAKSMPTRYEPAACGIKPNHFKVSSGATYLKTGIETDVPENRARALDNGENVIIEAMKQNGQEKNPAAWYYLGRIYLQQGDLQGADTALTRAEQLAPNCAQEIGNYRRNAWAALIKAGSKFEESKNLDSALALYQQANAIYRGSPIAFYQTASLLNDRGQTDSAAYYFGLAAASTANATDTNDIKYRNRSAFNQGALLLNAKKYDQAAAAFEQYRKWVPDDNEGKRALAQAYRGQGQTDKAAALEKELIAAGGTPATTGATAATDLMNTGVNLYNEKKYDEAAKAFEQVVAGEPYNRDALSNLSNTYLVLKNGPKLAETAARLVAIEPLSETALKLQGEGYKQSKKMDDAVRIAEAVLALPVDVKATDFETSASGATLKLKATGRAAQTAAGKPIAPVAAPISVEFLSANGGVVATQDAEIPALASGASQDITVTAQGTGIAAWRYKRK